MLVQFNCLQVYTFVSIGSAIPLIIFTAVTLYMKVNHDWVEILYSVPEVIFALIEIFSLTFSPASMQNAVSQIEPLIYENRRIWLTDCPRLHEIAHLYVQMAKQTNLGISIWGFAIVNKPLILTVIISNMQV